MAKKLSVLMVSFCVLLCSISNLSAESNSEENPSTKTAGTTLSRMPFDIGVGVMNRCLFGGLGLKLRTVYHFGGPLIGVDLEKEAVWYGVNSSMNGLIGYGFETDRIYMRVYGTCGYTRYKTDDESGNKTYNMINPGAGLELKPVQWFGVGCEWVLPLNKSDARQLKNDPLFAIFGIKFYAMVYCSF